MYGRLWVREQPFNDKFWLELSTASDLPLFAVCFAPLDTVLVSFSPQARQDTHSQHIDTRRTPISQIYNVTAYIC